jgi:splicing factor 3B subunit 2
LSLFQDEPVDRTKHWGDLEEEEEEEVSDEEPMEDEEMEDGTQSIDTFSR